ncbi:hypothetical protein PORY_002468, partial [Pneumocystis oryctolagi]
LLSPLIQINNKSVDINNDFESNNKCFMDIGSLKFPLFFPHFDNKELYALSSFSKVPNIFSQKIDNEEIERNWVNSRVEFTQNWKRKWKNAQKRKRKLFYKKNLNK